MRAAAGAIFWSLYARVYDLIWDAPLTATVAAQVVDGVRSSSASEGCAADSVAGTVVDLGCGTGLIARGMTGAGFAVTGVDLDAGMLRRARRTGRLSNTVRADAAGTGLEQGSADIVLAVNVLQVHPDPVAVLVEARRLAAAGAAIVLVWPTDAATHEQLNAVDRALGRSRASVFIADVARRAIGRAAWLTGVRRRPDAGVLNEIEDAIDLLGLIVVERLELHRCQRMLVLRVGAHGTHGELSPSTASPQLP